MTALSNAEMVTTVATRRDDHRRAWAAIGKAAEARIDKALADLEEVALTAIQARRANFGHILELAVGVAESKIAAAQIDLEQARRHSHG
jgi:hypothetical protein